MSHGPQSPPRVLSLKEAVQAVYEPSRGYVFGNGDVHQLGAGFRHDEKTPRSGPACLLFVDTARARPDVDSRNRAIARSTTSNRGSGWPNLSERLLKTAIERLSLSSRGLLPSCFRARAIGIEVVHEHSPAIFGACSGFRK